MAPKSRLLPVDAKPCKERHLYCNLLEYPCFSRTFVLSAPYLKKPYFDIVLFFRGFCLSIACVCRLDALMMAMGPVGDVAQLLLLIIARIGA